MIMAWDYVIFDMDGVLSNTEPIHFQVWRKTLASRGIDLDFEKYKPCIGSTLINLKKVMLEQYGVDLWGDEQLIPDYMKENTGTMQRDGVEGISGVPEMLKKLTDRGVHMAVASSSPMQDIELVLTKLDIKKYFEVICTGEDVPSPKPAPDIFLKAARLLHADPAQCLVVEDSRNGSRAAKAAGMYCIGFVSPASGDQDLSAADRIIYHYSQMQGVLY